MLQRILSLVTCMYGCPFLYVFVGVCVCVCECVTCADNHIGAVKHIHDVELNVHTQQDVPDLARI